MPPTAIRPEAAVERVLGHAAFFEHVGEGPERHHVDDAVALGDVSASAGPT